MKTRTVEENARIVEELMSGCPEDEGFEDCRTPRTDHQKMADAIIDGVSKKEILEMDEMEYWPETYTWLENEIPDDEDEDAEDN